ncbi:MAG: bifunctional folylpolyglutamate synthase/dihydrofolate synthase [Rudaea sp.]
MMGRTRREESTAGLEMMGPPGDVESRYGQSLRWLLGLTDLERMPMSPAMLQQMTLARPTALLEQLGMPQARYPAILVAGSKGKGSTAAMLASVLSAAGNRTGFYSKPHLHTYRERIRIDGALISKVDFSSEVERLHPIVDRLARERPEVGQATTFEVTTVAALDYFARRNVQVAVVEVGLGGRLDATNVLDPVLSIITPISLEHTAVLGNTLGEIAGEKAGIMRPDGPVLSSGQADQALDVLRATARTLGAPFAVAGRDWTWRGDHAQLHVASTGAHKRLWSRPWAHPDLALPLLGVHQLENAATVVAAAEVLSQAESLTVDHLAIVKGLANTRWPGRLEIAAPRTATTAPVIVDGAHNGDSAERLWEGIRRHFEFERLFLVLAVYTDKDVAAIVGPFRDGIAQAWTTQTSQPRCRPSREVAAELQRLGIRATPAPSTAEAVDHALAAAGPRDLVCVTGSLSVVAEAREALRLVGAAERD